MFYECCRVVVLGAVISLSVIADTTTRYFAYFFNKSLVSPYGTLIANTLGCSILDIVMWKY